MPRRRWRRSPPCWTRCATLKGFSQITDSRIIQRGRELKNQFEEEFFHPDVLTPIVNYSLLFGKIFHAMLQETMQKVHGLARGQPDSNTPDPDELLRSDYRFYSRRLPPVDGTGPGAGVEENGGQCTGRLGSDGFRQVCRRMGTPDEESGRGSRHPGRAPQKPGCKSLPCGFGPSKPSPASRCLGSRWPSTTGNRAPSGPNMRNRSRRSVWEFARSLCHAISIISRIQEELTLTARRKIRNTCGRNTTTRCSTCCYEGRPAQGYVGAAFLHQPAERIAGKIQAVALDRRKTGNHFVRGGATSFRSLRVKLPPSSSPITMDSLSGNEQPMRSISFLEGLTFDDLLLLPGPVRGPAD